MCVLIRPPTNREELFLCEKHSVDVAPTAKKDRGRVCKKCVVDVTSKMHIVGDLLSSQILS